MSASEKVTKKKEKSVDFAENKELPAKLRVATSKMCTRPRFASHTQSSLMKTRTPINLKKSMKSVRKSNKSQGNITHSRLSGICKKQDSVKKQSRSIQTLMTILKREKNCRASIFLQGSKVTAISCQSEQCAENSFIFLQSDLIKNVSCDLKRYTGSPAKLVLRSESTKQRTKIIDRPESTEDSHVSLQDDIKFIENSSAFLQSSLENICNVPKDRTIVDIARKLQSQSSDDEEESVNSHCEIEVHDKLRQGESKRRLEENFSNKEHSEIGIQMFRQTVSANANSAANRKCNRKWRKTWNNGKATNGADLQSSRNLKFMKHVDDSQDKDIGPVVNDDIISARKKSALQKTLVFINQQTWKPPGITKTSITKTTTSLTQPVSQKSSRSIERSVASTSSKHSSIKHIESFDSESTSASISANHSKVLMKENRDPHVNRVTKICEHLAEVKQQRLQNVGTLPKKKHSVTKVASNVSNKCDDTIKPKSKSRHWYMQPITPKRSSKNQNDVEQHHIKSTLIHGKRSKPSEIINTLKEIIDSVREDEDMEDNVSKNYISIHEKSDNELQTFSNRDASLKMSRSELNFTKNKSLDEVSRSFNPSFCKSIGTQTELNLSPYLKIDSEKGDSKEISKPTRIAATQTSPNNKNTVEIGCNTTLYDIIHKDVGVSCDLIGSMNSEVDLIIEDELTTHVPIHTTELSSIKYTEIKVEDEYPDESKKLSECNKTLNTEKNLKLKNCNSEEILTKTTSDFIMEAEEIMHEKTCRLSLSSFKNFDDRMNTDIDKHQESIKCSNNRDANNDSIDNLFPKKSRQPSLSIYDCDASCSSDEVTEYLEDDVPYKDIIAPEFKIENIPSDVIAAFELAAERARNLRKAVIIYHENLMKKSEKRNEETAENYEIPKVRKDPRCLEEYASSINCESKNRIKFECNAKSRFVVTNGEDFDGSSTCTLCSSNSDEISETKFPKLSKADYSEIDREEKNAIVPRGERAITKSILTEHSDLAAVPSSVMVCRTQEKYALEPLQLEKDGNDESFEMEETTLMLPMAIKKTSIISREILLTFIYCILCTIVFWYLQFSFRCDSAM